MLRGKRGQIFRVLKLWGDCIPPFGRACLQGKVFNPNRPRTFDATPKYYKYELWIHGRQVGFAAESGKVPACYRKKSMSGAI